MKNKVFIQSYILVLLASPVLVFAQDNNQNWVKQIDYKTPVAAPITNPTALQATVNVTYADGLGRPVLSIANQQSDLGKDIITPIEYDAFGRKIKEYLPYVSTTQAMDFVTTAQAVSNVTGYQDYANQNPYSEKQYDDSPLNRVMTIAAPGTASNWAMGSGHEIQFQYRVNVAPDMVREFKYTAGQLVEGSPFGPNSLYKNVTVDENGHETTEFVNLKSQTILKRANDGSQNLDTYYVYDDEHNNLVIVIPPLAAGQTAINQAVLDKLCYQYHYDDKNRLIEKRLPQKQWEYIVYDELSRIVATGPAHSPYGSDDTAQGWLESQYDIHNRIAYSFWVPETFTAASRQNLQNTYNGVGVTNALRASSGIIDGVPVSYTTANLPANLILLMVNYYDRYDFPDAGAALTASPQTPFYDDTNRPMGLPTGSWTRILDANSPPAAGITSVLLYDYRGRVIYTWKSNRLRGHTASDTYYDPAGQPVKVITEHHHTDVGNPVVTTDNYTFTNAGRADTHTQIINSSNPNAVQFISQNLYSDLGRLKSKECGGNSAANYLQQVNYSYNIRGWLTGINDVAALSQSGEPQDLFAFKINYDTVEGFNSLSPGQYNGNISETYWRTSGDNILRKYAYFYDGANRMTDANYQKPQVAASSNSYQEQLNYDANGNITYLHRNGNMDLSTTNNEIDELNYFYDTNDGLPSNRLLGVIDDTHSPLGFKDDDSYSASDYVYDENGNLISDANKNISQILYNHLNLPTKIIFGSTGKQIDYIYDAAGTKLQKKFTNADIAETDYIDGYQYYDGILKFFATAEGYVSNTVVEDTNVFNYVYNYTDHLGNIRLSYGKDENGNTKTLEENHYYPFGLRHTNYNNDLKEYGKKEDELAPAVVLKPPVDDDGQLMAPTYKYKFNGKEWQDELGLKMTAMDFRQYDNAIGRFNGMDALGEMSFSYSPYNFSYNNPAYWVDPSGLFGEGNSWIENLWNASGEGVTTWHNSGSGGFFHGSSLISAEDPVSIDTHTGTVSEALTEVTIYSNRSDAYNFNIIQQHVYNTSNFYGSTVAVDTRPTEFGMGLMEYVEAGGINFALKAAKASRVFWSGGREALEAAITYSKATGGTTLEMTRAGQNLEKLIESKQIPWSEAKPMWERLSSVYAKGAKGSVHFFEGSNVVPGSIWMTVEKDILIEKGLNIITHK